MPKTAAPARTEHGVTDQGEADDAVAKALGLLAFMVALVTMAAPVAQAPTRLALGAPEGEAMAHLWGLVVGAQGFARHGPFVRDTTLVAWPGGVHLDLVDPLHLLLVAPGWWLLGMPGAVLSWNLLHIFSLALLALGAWLLARHIAPTRPLVAALATAGALSTPYLWSGLLVGRSELLGLLTVPLLLALLGRATQQGAQTRWMVASSLLLWALAASGWQPLIYGGLVLLPSSLMLAWRDRVPPRRLAWRLLWVGLPAALFTLPMLWTQLVGHPWWMSRVGGMVAFGTNPFSVDLLETLRISALRPAMSTAVAPYPGWLSLALLIVALFQRNRCWALLATGLLVLSLGSRVVFGDNPTRYLMPVWLLVQAIPPLGGLNDWGRLALATGPMLSLAGAVGLSRWLVGRRGRVLAVLLGALLMVDGLSFRLLGPADVAVDPPAELSQAYKLLPEGPVLELPGIVPSNRDAQFYNDQSLLWSLRHGHPVQAAPSPYSSPMLSQSMLMRMHLDRRRTRHDLCAPTEPGRLYRLGYRAVVLLSDRLRSAGLGEDRVTWIHGKLAVILGKEAGQNASLTWWRLDPGPTGPASCASRFRPAHRGRQRSKGRGTGPVGPPPVSWDWPG